MPRAVSGVVSHKRHKKILKRAKGCVGARSRTFRRARETTDRAGVYAYSDRRVKKRNFRRLWITRISAAVVLHGLSYGRFMYALKLLDIDLNRKCLSELAIHEEDAFKVVVLKAKEKLESL